MKKKLINKIILSIFVLALCVFNIPKNVFASADPGEYQYLRHWLEDEDFIEAYADLLEDLQCEGSSLEIECVKEYSNSFNRFRSERDRVSHLPNIMIQISEGLSVFSSDGCARLMEAMDKLCKEEYEKFKEGYQNIPTIICGLEDNEIASKRFCNGKYEIKLSRQGAYIIVKHFV